MWKLRHFHCWLQWKTIAVNDKNYQKESSSPKRKRCQHALNGDLHEFQYLFRISMETEGLLSPSAIFGWWRKTFSDHPEIGAMISGWSSKFFYHHPCRKTFRYHPNPETDTETDAGYKRLWIHYPCVSQIKTSVVSLSCMEEKKWCN